MTPKPLRRTALRHAWLKRLENGPQNRLKGDGQVAFDCLQAGRTEWVVPAGQDTGSQPDYRQQLTDLGRTTLAEWDAAAFNADLRKSAPMPHDD